MDIRQELIEGINTGKALNRDLNRSYYKYDFYGFSKEVVGWKDIYEPLHKPLCNFITDNVKKKQLLIELPRGTFKSSIVTIGYSLWKIANNPNIRILIVNATYPMVTKFISQTQDNLKKNPRILQIYGELAKDAEIWNENTIKLKTDKSFETKEPTVFGYGMTGNLVSTHFDLIILDDLVNWDNTTTRDQIQKVISFYRTTLDLLEPKGELIIIGTPYNYSDLYSWIEDPENNILDKFAVFKKAAYEGDWKEGNLLFPERLSWNRLEELRVLEGPSHWSSQYMLEPVLDEDAIFKYDFKYYEEEDLKGVEVLTFMTVDPAISASKDADKTAFVVISVDKENNWYIRDIRTGRYGVMELIRELFYMDEKWKPISIGIEVVAYQKALSTFIQEEVKRGRKAPLPIKELKPETSRTTGLSEPKQYRIQSLEPRYASGKIYHLKTLRETADLEDQLRRFPRTPHDDIIDALAYMEQLAFQPRIKDRRGEFESQTGKKWLY